MAGFWIWLSYPNEKPSSDFYRVSVLIAARNEEKNLPALFQSMEKLRYPKEYLEIIFVNDFSDDNTAPLIQAYQEKSRYSIQFLQNERTSSTPKRDALNLAIQKAKGDLLVFTDADCQVPKNWIHFLVSSFSEEKVNLAFGPIKYAEDRFLGNLLSIEQAALLGSSLASLAGHIPSMCNGANMAIRRKTFEELGGFDSPYAIASGDDELLLHKVFCKDPSSVHFVKSKEAIVTTEAVRDWGSLYAQRTRWAGKWEKYLLWQTKAFAFFIFVVHVAYLILPFVAWHQEFLGLFIVVLFLKIGLEWLFISQVMTFLGKKINASAFVVLQVIYSPYVVFFGLVSRRKKYTWKGRRLK
jgi:cellulose synthase/poly-beta-1,6-N-acetylglucosamine synthase-like glycosyltransferase